ncbi:MAG TPA: hypothetical protein VEF03_09835, partial [Candidatus Binataceae bacterium]|nr:hypothetical protein [Candidatus Binataceae bacterium]
MKLHHAAALALVGWYLITPPVVFDAQSKSTQVDQNAPLSQWKVRERFEKQKDCEEALQLGLKKPEPPKFGSGGGPV